uniref:sn-1-specific diacylglycerol lipase n=2 Tax=Auxenochlorella protothecoides TaxID=3075 RepID=A0A1D1ZLV4_AUXPR
MPAVRLWGRRWHFSTDIVPIPAAINGAFHFVWICVLLFGAIGSGEWPSGCNSATGRQYVALFAGLFGAFVLNLIIDVLLYIHGMKGSPFEVSKRHWVPTLLHISTLPIVAQFVFTAFGTHVVNQQLDDCWPADVRHGVRVVARILVYSTWGLMAIIALGIAITYNLYPEHKSQGSWEQRCECIAVLLCCRSNMRRRPAGKRPPLSNIAELTSGLLSHVDLEATDLMTAVILTSAAQNRRRRLRLAKALLPVYEALRQTGSRSSRSDPGTAASSAGDSDSDSEAESGDEAGASSDGSSVHDVPASRRLTRRLEGGHSERGRAAAPRETVPRGPSRFDPGPGLAGPRSRKIVTFEQLVSPGQPVEGGEPRPEAPEVAIDTAASLPLTESNVALMDRLASASVGGEESAAGGGDDGKQEAAAVAVTNELHDLAANTGQDAGELADALADAIQDELEDLGGGDIGATHEDAVLQVDKAPSLDLALLADGASSIWLNPSVATQAPSVSNQGEETAPGSPRRTQDAEFPAGVSDSGPPDSPSVPPATGSSPSTQPPPVTVPEGVDPLPSREAVVAARQAGAPGSEGRLPSEASQGARSGSVRDLASVTLRFPTVITPSQYVNRLAGKLPPEALADIYAGRHDRVGVEVLEEATYFLKYAYAVYSLQPKIENPSSILDMACWKPPAPQDVVFSGFNELEQLEDDSTIELLHLNCSNRMLAHLPYLIALDHVKKAVVLAIRGTISAADIVTDAMVASERLEHLLPVSLKEDVKGPCFGHTGMLAAAQAIFMDMKERGILTPLVGSEAAADDYSAPRGEGPPQRESQYDADTGPSPLRAAMGSAGQAIREGVAAVLPAGGWTGAGRPGDAVGDDIEAQRAAARDSDGPRVTVDKLGAQKSPGQKVGELMKVKLLEDDWQLMVVGHSLGAGAAALISLQLLDHCPGLKCLAYSCPGALVSKNLAHAMASFTTTIVVGKDAVPRASVANLGRLMDEMVTSLARCKQPKLKVTFYPWWKRKKQDFKNLFWDYDKIPEESLEVLRGYYDSRVSGGQPMSMYPPGRLIFVRPIKTRRKKAWDCVWISPEDIIDEGILLSPHMLTDHLCSTAWEALHASLRKAKDEDAKPSKRGFKWQGRLGRRPQQHYRYERQTSEQRSLHQELIAD